MKELTDSEKLDIAMSIMTDDQIDEYAEICYKCETQEKIACVDIDCTECQLTKEQKDERDCPFMDC